MVKGTEFKDLRQAGDPVEMAAYYSKEGAHELVFLDISATGEGRRTVVELVRRTARAVKLPFCVGGGIRSLEEMEALFDAGADKVSVGTAGFARPSLIQEASRRYGSSRVVVAVDARWSDDMGAFEVYLKGGTEPTGARADRWARQVEELGAGEILLTSIDQDGGEDGYDMELTSTVAGCVSLPVIASGGAGTMEHFARVLTRGGADAALAASVFHFGKIKIPALKEYLRERGIEV